MRPVRTHTPGSPTSEEPPERLVELTDRVRHPLVRQSGLTCTADGRWAMFVTVPKETEVPIPAVEAQAAGFPVVYEAEPDTPPRAGPARPRGRK